MSKKSSKLIEISKMFDEIDVNLNDLSKEGITDMITIIKKQNDSRYQPNVKHKMEDIILITLFAVMAKCNEWTEIESFAKKKEQWLRNYLELPNGIPSHDTIQRVISVLNPSTLYSDCINYLIGKIDAITSCDERDILSADGKQSNGSKREVGINKDEKPVNTMSVYSTNYGLSLIQDFIDEKSNEIPMMPKLLEKLNLKDCVVTADALNTQVDTIKAILGGHADYVLPVKENQKLTYEEVKEYFEDKKLLKEALFKKTISKEHNGIITREYYITSLKGDIELFSKSVKAEWGVENNLHAPLDIVFKEDKNKTLKKNGADNLGIIRRIALAILKFVQTYYKISLNLIRTNLSFDFENEIINIIKLLDVNTLKNLKNAKI